MASHTARGAVLSASLGLRAPLCLLLQGSALLHFPVQFYTSEGKIKNADANTKKHRSHKLCLF